MLLIFRNVFAEPKKAYITDKLKRTIIGDNDLESIVNSDELSAKAAQIQGNQTGVSVPIAEKYEHYQITQEQEAEIEARKRCVMATLLRQSPLLEGETVEEDFFSFLKESYADLPENTAVLKRTTNKAELIYIFDDVQVINGNLQFKKTEPAKAEITFPRRTSSISSSAIKSIAQGLGSGIVSGIGGKIGALIFDAIFPPGVPDYFDEVYKEIRKIVSEELTTAHIDSINGRINGVVAWARKTYAPRKEANVSREELFGMLKEQVNLLYTDAVYTLMEPRYAKPGISVFMIAAGVHLALIQEQALVDPAQLIASKSSFATSVKLNAQDYANHLTSTYNKVLTDRLNKIKIKDNPLDDPSNPSSINTYSVLKHRYYYHDEITGKKGRYREDYTDKDKNKHYGREEAEADRNNYIPGVKRQFHDDLSKPLDLSKTWQKLTEKPLP